MQELMVKKIAVEPYVHLSIEQVNTIFGQKEAFKSLLLNQIFSKAVGKIPITVSGRVIPQGEFLFKRIWQKGFRIN
jgi:hypothetical protein